MSVLHTDYFQQEDIWADDYRCSPAEEERLRATIQQVPEDARSVLDVGCGSGLFVNAVSHQPVGLLETIAGVDLSKQALRKVRTSKFQCTASKLPFRDRSFDLVTSFEMIEHIARPDYDSTLREMMRVSKRYVLVSVPNREALLNNLVVCPHCCCCFSPWHHVNSFDKPDMQRLFPGFKLCKCLEIGPLQERRIYYAPIKGALLFGKPPLLPPLSICPQCGYRAEKEKERSHEMHKASRRESGVHNLLRRILTRKTVRKKWLLALYVRKGTNQA